MKFYEKVKKLQKENDGYVILVRCGIFYNAIGKDAVFMQKEFGLGTICLKNKVCKNGISINSIKKFIPKLQKSGYSYKIYDYSKVTNEVKELCTIEGKLIEETKINMGCENCKYYKKQDFSIEDSIKYLEGISNRRITL